MGVVAAAARPAVSSMTSPRPRVCRAAYPRPGAGGLDVPTTGPRRIRTFLSDRGGTGARSTARPRAINFASAGSVEA